MKLKLLFFLLAVLHLSVKAQHYQSIFGKQSTSWEIRWDNLPGEFQSTLSVQKDTIVNGLSYKKIVTNGFYYKGGLLRGDTVIGKVWYKKLYPNSPQFPYDTTEVLAFDYSLSVGDTFDIDGMGYGMYGNYPDSFNIVKRVYYQNNLKHIEFKGPTTGFFTMIEGIGGTFGMIWKQDFGYKRGQYLLCSYKDGAKTSYTNTLYQGRCNITGILEDNLVDQISIYPNPAHNRIFIRTNSKSRIKNYRILNTLGQLVSESEMNNQQLIDICTLPVGLYILQLRFNHDKMYQQRFFKQ